MDAGKGASHTGACLWVGEGRRGIALGEITNVDDRLMGAANHHGRGIPMEQTYTFCTCTPELKIVKKKKKQQEAHSPQLERGSSQEPNHAGT